MDTSRPLLLYNSLTRQKEPFVPRNGRRVTWYNCGPTVYDHSHMGHARSYVTFDIIRRVLQDYFGYDVQFVQNVTDIDDKIIRRARQQHLLSQYQQNVTSGVVSPAQAAADVEAGIAFLGKRASEEVNEDKKSVMLKSIAAASRGLEERASLSDQDFVDLTKDVLIEYLDHLHCSSSEFPNEIFSRLPKFFEEDFNRDMSSLSVLPPSVVTRVSEYVPEIIRFIEGILRNGFAYESNGSVYFDVARFSSKHTYAKLVREAVGDVAALADGEGDLFVSHATASEKRSPADFVLWKKSKPGEPKWSSPWGGGRPGWHIECSVMAYEILGHEMDIHSGGCDLRFPHHDNEIAQSEAFFDSGNPWVRTFLHSGHLNIDGQKMSKSLKNFTTIKDALKSHTQRQLRLAFLLHNWKDTLNYSSDTMAGAVSDDKYFSEFFLNTKDVVDKANEAFVKWSPRELELNAHLLASQEKVDDALRDNIDTKTAVVALKELVKACNSYLRVTDDPHPHLLRDVVSYVSRILAIFGVMDAPVTPGASSSQEDLLRPVLKTLAHFRQEVRSEAIVLKSKGILAACDRLRDEQLPLLGIRLEDREGSHESVIKVVDRETLVREREEKRRQEEERRLQEEAKKQERERERKEKERLDSLSPAEWAAAVFPRDKYSAFDERGIPTHDAVGEELSKSQRKKLVKEYETRNRRVLGSSAGAGGGTTRDAGSKRTE